MQSNFQRCVRNSWHSFMYTMRLMRCCVRNSWHSFTYTMRLMQCELCETLHKLSKAQILMCICAFILVLGVFFVLPPLGIAILVGAKFASHFSKALKLGLGIPFTACFAIFVIQIVVSAVRGHFIKKAMQEDKISDLIAIFQHEQQPEQPETPEQSETSETSETSEQQPEQQQNDQEQDDIVQ